jgi:hypothetical protein
MCPVRTKKIVGSPGRMARGCAARPSLRSGPPSLRAGVQADETPACRTDFLSVGGSNSRVEP